MISVHDLAQYLIANHPSPQHEGINSMKLHKSAYFCQAYSLAWTGEPMFAENVLAGNSGPVIDEFYDHHRGIFQVISWPAGNKERLSASDKVVADSVLKMYEGCTGRNLSNISMGHLPWKHAQERKVGDVLPVMDLTVMRNYYRALSDAPSTPREYAERFMDRYENTDHL